MTNLAQRGTAGLGEQLRRRKPIGAVRPGHGGELERSFGTFQLMMFGVGATVGTGIFFVLQEAVPDAGPAVVVSFLVAGLGAGLSAICYAEVAGAIPVSGSTYSYAYHALGELVAMVVVACVLLEYGVSSAAVAVGWSGYFNELLDNLVGVSLPDALSYSPIPFEDNTTGLVNLPAIVLVLMCMVLLVRGASESARVNTVMVLVKLGVLLMFVVIGFSAFEADHFDGFWDAGAAGVSAAAATIFFSFIGLDAVSTAGEEVRDPQRALPRAIMGALAVVVTIYVLVAVAGVGAQPVERFEDPEQQSAGLSVILENITGSSVPATVLAAGAVISIFSVTLVTLYGQTRILFAMGRDGMLPDRFASVNPRTLTPTFNTVVVSVVVAVIAGFVPADYLWDTVSIGTLIAFIVVATAVLVLRRTAPDLERPFRVPGYPVTPLLTIAVCLYILSGLAAITWLIFAVWLAVVLSFYLLWGRRHAALGRGEVATADVPEDRS
ncbi:amino acid permease [Nocardioides aurantiacus]|uniref:Amino acid/polyamine/organocation transporter (APC superfamily) n=1 Tax=Nocardioides aurantiacus TaxID=86796 RepID=A0A3N2CYV0_9ACTN|nr:amino acid permease [Nocardioides aurantiacus]ROR92712.1 amino acid/polyamine/organocation transporter (APC superfamily) [Nocardioides aurantiacus]